MKQPEIEMIRRRHYREHDVYFFFDDPSQGRLRYREDDFIDDAKGTITNVRARLTLIGQKARRKIRKRSCSPAAASWPLPCIPCASIANTSNPNPRFAIEKDRLRWLIKYKDTEFFVNLDQMTEPELGYFLEIKSRTWSRKDAELKAQLTSELLALLGASDGEHVTEDYIDIVSEA